MDESRTSTPKGGLRKRFKRFLNPLRAPQGSTHDSMSSLTPSRPVTPALSVRNEAMPNIQTLSSPDLAAPPDSTGSPSLSSWAKLRATLNSLTSTSSAFGPLQSATHALTNAIDVYEAAATNQHNYDEMANELNNAAEILLQYLRESTLEEYSNGFQRIARSIEEQSREVQARRQANTKRLASASSQDDVLESYRKVQGAFTQLQREAGLQTWRSMNRQHIRALLRELSPVEDAIYDSAYSTIINRRRCAQNTRVDILEDFHKWVNDPDKRLYWMCGMAGTGKTALAYSLCQGLEERQQLGANFFCSRDNLACRSSQQIIPTIAYQLANYSFAFRSKLCQVLTDEPDIRTRNVSRQFERLIVSPLIEIRDALPMSVIVVIDGLDECENQRDIKNILDLIIRNVHVLPLKLFLSSRPGPIVRYMELAQSPDTRLYLHELDPVIVQADIKLYLHEALASTRVCSEDLDKLVRRAGVLFLYAAAIVQYVIPDDRYVDSDARLRDVLSATPPIFKQVASVYSGALRSALDPSYLPLRELDDMKLVLWTCVCSSEPMTVELLAKLIGLTEGQVNSALKQLRSVLNVGEYTTYVTTLHVSFCDYIFSPNESGEFHCVTEAHNETLAIWCFELMTRKLEFNICKLETSIIPDSNIYNLRERVRVCISPALSYSSRYWASHLRHSHASSTLTELLNAFLSNQLLFWIEVLNLQECAGYGYGKLHEAQTWMITNYPNDSTGLHQRLTDARDFLFGFSSSPCSLSTPHIYISALSLCPRSNWVYQQYSTKTRGLISSEGMGMTRARPALVTKFFLEESISGVTPIHKSHAPFIALVVGGGWVLFDASIGSVATSSPSLTIKCIGQSMDGCHFVTGSEDGTMTMWNMYTAVKLITFTVHEKSVECTSFSYDNNRIVSGSADGTVCVSDSKTGRLILGPLRGHADWITATQFSPDDQYIASASDDGVICLWDVQSGGIIGLIRGHTDRVTCLAFSPNGTRLASGSDDRTICVWDVSSKQKAVGPIKGHTRGITSIIFSLDGSNIISGSHDCTVRVWDARSGHMILEPLRGHVDSVTALTFLADDVYVASTGRDGALCVWNILPGLPRFSFIQGHAEDVTSVAFSTNGNTIVSGSGDDTLMLWDSHTGKTLSSSICTHSEGVTSVSFSPDDTCVVSSGQDNSIYIWNIPGGEIRLGPLKGHTETITSVEFSPNGNHILSSSHDMSIRVWDIRTGESKVLAGHTDWVRAAQFSSDSSMIVSGSDDLTVRIWDLRYGNTVIPPLRGHTRIVTSVSFFPDCSRVVSGSRGNGMIVWDAHDGRIVLGPLNHHSNWVTSIKCSPNGLHIISGSHDGSICVWNAQNGDVLLGPLRGHTNWVTSVDFSPDGAFVVSSSKDKNIRVWDIRSASELGRSQSTALTSLFSPCMLNQNGWIVSSRSELLIWVPPDVRDVLVHSEGVHCMSRQGHLALRFAGALIGDSWAGCYL